MVRGIAVSPPHPNPLPLKKGEREYLIPSPPWGRGMRRLGELASLSRSWVRGKT